MSAALAERELVMHFRRRRHPPRRQAFLAQRVRLDVAVTDLTPSPAIADRRIVWAFVLVVPLVHDVYMVCTIHIVREVRAAWESARLFRFSRHSFPLFKCQWFYLQTIDFLADLLYILFETGSPPQTSICLVEPSQPFVNNCQRFMQLVINLRKAFLFLFD